MPAAQHWNRIRAGPWLAGLALGLIWGGHAAAAAPVALNPVADLRLALQGPIRDTTPGSRDLEVRYRLLWERVARLCQLPDWRDALLLQEWRDDDSDEGIAAVDRAARVELIRRFDRALHASLHQPNSIGCQAAIHLIGQLAASIPNGIQGWTLRQFSTDLAELVMARDFQVRQAAARTLGQIHPDASIAVPALTVLFEADHPVLRRAAAEGLAGLMRGVAQALRQPSGQVTSATRIEVVQVGRAVVPVVCGGLADPDLWVRRWSIEATRQTARALGKLVSDLRMVVREDPADVEAFGREVAAERADLTPLAADLKDQTGGLTNALGDADAEVRLLAHQALEELGLTWQKFQKRAASVSELAPAVRNASCLPGQPKSTGPDSGTVTEAGGQPPPLLVRLRAALPAVAAGLRDRDVAVRRAAVDALEVLGDEAAPAVPGLIAALNDPDPFVRWGAARALGKMTRIDPSPLVPALVRLLGDRDVDVRLAAAETFRRWGPAAWRAVPALVRVMRLGDPDLSVAIVRTLEAIGPAAAATVPDLAALLDEPQARVRQASARLLGKFGPAAATACPKLRVALDDPDPTVRKAANDALLEIIPPPPGTRSLLGQMSPPPAIPAKSPSAGPRLPISAAVVRRPAPRKTPAKDTAVIVPAAAWQLVSDPPPPAAPRPIATTSAAPAPLPLVVIRRAEAAEPVSPPAAATPAVGLLAPVAAAP